MRQAHVMEFVLWLGIIGVITTGSIAILFEDGGILDLCKWTRVEMERAPVLAATLILVFGLNSFLKVICLNLAWQLEAAPIVTMAHMYSLIVFELLFEITVEEEYLPLLPMIGVFVVFATGMTVILARYHHWKGF
jgi:hypothetical protein